MEILCQTDRYSLPLDYPRIHPARDPLEHTMSVHSVPQAQSYPPRAGGSPTLISDTDQLTYDPVITASTATTTSCTLTPKDPPSGMGSGITPITTTQRRTGMSFTMA